MRVLFLVMCFCFSHLVSKEKYKLSVCAIFSNEAKFLEEWIEYHRLAGVEHFYLYCNNSSDTSRETLEKYTKEGIVTLTNWLDPLGKLSETDPLAWAQSTQITAFENAIQLRKEETEWLVFLDICEFLIPTKDGTLPEILEKYDEYAAIKLDSQFFDASLKDSFSEGKLIIEHFDLIGTPSMNLYKSVKKLIVKPKLCKQFIWPPYEPVFDPQNKVLSLTEYQTCVNHYVHRKSPYLFSHSKRVNIDNRYLTKDEEMEILNAGYEYEDKKKTVLRFLPELQRKMERE